tara:strand:- start:313 stop:648 length:336 start_codon:yes stop_codon:yes gene_type:complete
MGYRSKVIIGVKSGKLSDEFDEILKKHKFPEDSMYLKIINDPNDMKTYQFEEIKWYSTEDWYKDIMDYIHKVSEDSDNAYCIGLGEDGQTHDEVGLFWEYVEQINEINLIN